jgi:hypothetical protein
VNCTLLALDLDDALPLLKFIVNMAYYYCKEEYLFELASHVNELDPAHRNDLLTFINDMIEKPKDNVSEFRIVGDMGEIEKFSFRH